VSSRSSIHRDATLLDDNLGSSSSSDEHTVFCLSPMMRTMSCSSPFTALDTVVLRLLLCRAFNLLLLMYIICSVREYSSCFRQLGKYMVFEVNSCNGSVVA
jgi:hypothetical protein